MNNTKYLVFALVFCSMVILNSCSSVSKDDMQSINEKAAYSMGYDIGKTIKSYDINDQKDPKLFTHGLSAGMYCKACLFRPSIEDINYTPGAHGFKPDPKYKVSKFQYRLFHYNKSWFNLENFYICHSFHPKEVVKDLYLKSLEKVRRLK